MPRDPDVRTQITTNAEVVAESVHSRRDVRAGKIVVWGAPGLSLIPGGSN